jgi:hypothetical protein
MNKPFSRFNCGLILFDTALVFFSECLLVVNWKPLTSRTAKVQRARLLMQQHKHETCSPCYVRLKKHKASVMKDDHKSALGEHTTSKPVGQCLSANKSRCWGRKTTWSIIVYKSIKPHRDNSLFIHIGITRYCYIDSWRCSQCFDENYL